MQIGNDVRYDVSRARQVEADGLQVREVSAEQRAAIEAVWQDQFRVPTGKPDNHPDYVYAQVKVGGNVVATIYNGGSVETSNKNGAVLRNLPSMGEGEALTGPALAQKRAADIAAALGGAVHVVATPQSLAAWEGRVPAGFTYDYDAMRKAMDARMASGTAYYNAQAIGQGYMAVEETADAPVDAQSMPVEESGKAEGVYESPEEEFLAYMNMTLEERLLMQILKEEGLTKEQFEQLPIEDKRKILAKLKERLEMTLGIDEQAEAARRRMGATGEDMAGGMMSLPDPLFAALG